MVLRSAWLLVVMSNNVIIYYFRNFEYGQILSMKHSKFTTSRCAYIHISSVCEHCTSFVLFRGSLPNFLVRKFYIGYFIKCYIRYNESDFLSDTEWYLHIHFPFILSDLDFNFDLLKWHKTLFYKYWPGFDEPVAVAIVCSCRRRDVIFFQPRINTWFRYFGVVKVYKRGFTAEFNGSINTTNHA